jgi:hypothetical protein
LLSGASWLFVSDGMHEFRPTDCGPVLAPLVSGDRCRDLGRGQPDAGIRAALHAATVEAAFAHAGIADREMAECSLAGLWLVHDFLDESHAISQGVETPTGAYWHGVMHRREGDFSNAKYWFRRAGNHEVLAELSACVPQLNGAFDPIAFVDACQAAIRSGGKDADFCRRVQQSEWELLFDFCYRRATAH